MSTKGSLHAAAKAKPKADWSLTHKAKRNSMLDFAKAIAASGEEEQGATPEKSQGFAMRPESSFYQAMSDVEALADPTTRSSSFFARATHELTFLIIDPPGARGLQVCPPQPRGQLRHLRGVAAGG